MGDFNFIFDDNSKSSLEMFEAFEALKKFYDGLCKVGFTPMEAITLLGTMLGAMARSED